MLSVNPISLFASPPGGARWQLQAGESLIPPLLAQIHAIQVAPALVNTESQQILDLANADAEARALLAGIIARARCGL